MDFFTTRYINELIKKEYLDFIQKYYSDIFSNPNKYIELTENKISQYLWWWYVKLLNSWTTSLQLWLLSLWVKAWDEIILPANTYSATAIAITNIWAIPVFADINLDNFTIDYKDIEKKITKKTKAIIPVHLYWYNCDMNNIIDLSNKYNLKILEDSSHAFGWEYFWQKLWTLWDVWAFSCHLTKNFWTFWNGWIFYTKNKEIFNKLEKYIFPDFKDKEILNSWRTPANMLAMDSIVLLLKLKYIDKIIEKNSDLYSIYLEKYKNNWFIFPKLDLDNHKLHIRNFVILSQNREEYINNWLWKQYYDIDLSTNWIFWNNIDILQNTEKFFRGNLAINFYFWKKDI